jgi:hypothetical protein
MKMTFEEAIDVLASEPLILESKLPRTAEEWKEISEIWRKKRDEQVKLLQDNPQWIGRPAELSTKKLIAKYNGYYKRAVEEWKNCEDYDERMAEEQRQADLEWEQQRELETMRNYDFDRGDWIY